MGFLTGKTAIITGAGRAVLNDGRCGSIGYGIATAYAKEGANIVITGRNESKLAAAKEELEKLYNIKVLTIQADVNASADNEAVVANVVKQTIDTFGHIDVLINNAQASASGVPLAEHTTEQFNLAMYSGLYAAFYYMKACYPYLKESILEALEDEKKYGFVLRAKGMVPAGDGTWVYFDYVPGESNVREGKPDVTGKFCVIGSKLNEAALAELFDRK